MGRPTRGPARPLQKRPKASAAQSLLNLMQDVRRFRIRNWYRLFVRAKETGHFGCVPNKVIGLVGEVHLGQHVAGEELALGGVLLSVAHVHELLGRYDDLFEEVV